MALLLNAGRQGVNRSVEWQLPGNILKRQLDQAFLLLVPLSSLKCRCIESLVAVFTHEDEGYILWWQSNASEGIHVSPDLMEPPTRAGLPPPELNARKEETSLLFQTSSIGVSLMYVARSHLS